MIFTKYPNDFCHKRKMYNFDPYNVFLAIATNIPQRLKTAFVLQGHMCVHKKSLEDPDLDSNTSNLIPKWWFRCH